MSDICFFFYCEKYHIELGQVSPNCQSTVCVSAVESPSVDVGNTSIFFYLIKTRTLPSSKIMRIWTEMRRVLVYINVEIAMSRLNARLTWRRSVTRPYPVILFSKISFVSKSGPLVPRFWWWFQVWTLVFFFLWFHFTVHNGRNTVHSWSLWISNRNVRDNWGKAHLFVCFLGIAVYSSCFRL